jgi:hypothetical protein
MAVGFVRPLVNCVSTKFAGNVAAFTFAGSVRPSANENSAAIIRSKRPDLAEARELDPDPRTGKKRKQENMDRTVDTPNESFKL